MMNDMKKKKQTKGLESNCGGGEMAILQPKESDMIKFSF